MWGFVDIADSEDQILANRLTMSSFEDAAIGQIRLSVKKRTLSSASMSLDSIVADFRRELPKDIQVDIETKGRQLRVSKHLVLASESSTAPSEETDDIVFVSFFYAERRQHQ
jgi:hypothetical protein